MQRFLIVALLSIRLVADAAETSDWRRIPAIPLYAPLDARPIGDYIHVKGAALKMGQTNWMSVPENCAYSGRYGICRAPGEDTLRKNWYIVDLDSGARMHPIIGFINALENAAFALNGTIDVDRILAYISNPRRVVTEKGVGILAVALKDLGALHGNVWVASDPSLPCSADAKPLFGALVG